MTTRKTSRIIQVAILVALLFAANSVLGYLLVSESQRAMTEQIQGRMTDLACSAAALLDGDELAVISEADQGSPAFKKALRTLGAFQDNVSVSYIYCLRQVGPKDFEFTVDPVDNLGQFGELTVYTEALGQAAAGKPSVDNEPYEDKWGRFYSAYCPVFDSDGNVASIVAVDFDATWFENRVMSINGMTLVNTLASLALGLIALVLVARMTRAESKHVNSLLQAERYDALTGLPNMGYFLEAAEVSYQEMVAAGQRPAMLYIDFIGMKLFNQKRGYAEGDKLLKAFSELLVAHFGKERCGRFGQDHFAVSTHSENLDARLDDFIAECGAINNGKNLPISIGVSVSRPDHRVGVSAACDQAKTACENNQDTVHSRYLYYDEEMMARSEQRQHVIDNIDRAIAEGWIQVHYQPIVRASTGKVCDEEALARWNDPERGMLSPADFVPVLEDVKLAYKLDLHVLDQTLAKMQRFADEGLYVVSGSINLSRSDFEVCDIVEEVRSRVDASNFGREKICIEITESALGSDFDFMKTQIERFHNLGFQVWMDDFGSEYSSLDYLQSLPFDLIKLDMRFMQGFDAENAKSKIILTELVKMSLALGIDTVAEGVETEEQVDFLRKIGCSRMQGYYYCKPIPLEGILKRYETGTAIGFENPDEAEYYSTLGRTNLYDLSSILRNDEGDVEDYFDTVPMALMECTDDTFSIPRCNQPYLHFLSTTIGDDRLDMAIPFAEVDPTGDNIFIQALQTCRRSGGQLTVDETLANGTVVHSFIRHIDTNPVTGASGIAVAVLAISKE